MSKRIARPWERKKGINRFSAIKQEEKQKKEKQAKPFPSPSYVQVDGNKYFSDRFYLLKLDNRDDRPLATRRCSCGANQPPPILDRSQLIQSLALKAAIVATYTMVPNQLEALFEGIPTLVLHGHKGLHKRLHNSKGESPTKKVKVEQPESIIKKEEEPPEEAWFKMQETNQEENNSFTLSEIHHLTQITTTWLPARRVAADLTNTLYQKPAVDDGVIVLDDSDDDDGCHIAAQFKGVDPAVARKRLSKRGVHHPKFMLLFETSGSLVVIVSTSNLTPQSATDGVWVQRFTPKDKGAPTKTNQERRVDGSDFGHVLVDFLQKQSDAAQVGQMLPAEFLKHYLTIPTLDSLLNSFDFDDSRVHLIATVPGEYTGRKATTHLGRKDGRQTFLYGAQRVEDVLVRCKDRLIVSDEDRLIAQPTSLGGYWKPSDMRSLAKYYMGGGRGSRDMLERMDILWPSQEFIKDLSGNNRSSDSNECEEDDLVTEGGSLFLSAHSFNTIDVDCISRMAQLEHSTPNQMQKRSPHFKSYARLFEGNDYALRQNHGVGKAAELFSWFLMTSACLSRGAQGIPTAESHVGGDPHVTYSNFELGILFCSQLQGESSDCVYCWKPSECLCTKQQETKKLIHLPIPHALRAQPYIQDGDDDANLCKTPYFHEVLPENACVGHMALTPYGKARAAKQSSGTLTLPP